MLHKSWALLYNKNTCTVSPDGDRIYVANQAKKHLVTLSRDGTNNCSLSDTALKWEYINGLHVTDSGHVLVCGFFSHTIIQVDRDGRQRQWQKWSHIKMV
ncbi:hypothetical protein DPMN_183061 [Dreissena polymorpha]|uniref:Uncharacterized protein n=1 Tax=Dreissena polymorpha TaxID=45954 RepID=A0A9D4I564_DREPO|nr:hypothetical protein DPMN_183061 [Dreissena polymorpha]